MIEVARSKYEFEDFKNLFDKPVEDANVYKAPPRGLVLTKVDYE